MEWTDFIEVGIIAVIIILIAFAASAGKEKQ